MSLGIASYCNKSVGKTSLIRQYVNNSFTPQYKATIGADFLTKEITTENKVLAMQIWDTAGQEKYHSLQGMFYKGSDGCIIVFDLTNAHSFQSIMTWKGQFEEYADIKKSSEFPFVIVGNKADLTNDRKVTAEKARKTCEDMGIRYLEVSAKSGINVEEAFNEIIKKYIVMTDKL